MRVDIAVLKAQLDISRDEVADLRAQKEELEKRVMELICEDEMRRSR
jgi:ubiquinone biosynthesis protein UbiJ